MSEKKELTENQLIKKLRNLDYDAWNSFDSSQYPKEQQDIIHREKNAFFVEWYKEHPDVKKTENQTQNDISTLDTQSPSAQYIAALKAQRAEYMANRDPAFIMYDSFYKALEDIHGEDFENHIRALCEFGLYKKKSEYEGSVKMFMKMAIPQLEANEDKRRKAIINGSKGGAPKGNKNALKY